MPFEVIAYTAITLAIPENRQVYSGRSHSLWYCDAQEKGLCSAGMKQRFLTG